MNEQQPSQKKGEEQKGKSQDRDPKNVGRNKINKESQKSGNKDEPSSQQDDQLG